MSEGPGRMYIGDERCQFFSVRAGDSIGAPGSMKDFLRGLSDEGGSPSLAKRSTLHCGPSIAGSKSDWGYGGDVRKIMRDNMAALVA